MRWKSWNGVKRMEINAPYTKAERRESAWDKYMARLPHCSRCGNPIAEPMVLCIEEADRKDYYCPRCIEDMTVFNEEAEIL